MKSIAWLLLAAWLLAAMAVAVVVWLAQAAVMALWNLRGWRGNGRRRAALQGPPSRQRSSLGGAIDACDATRTASGEASSRDGGFPHGSP